MLDTILTSLFTILVLGPILIIESILFAMLIGRLSYFRATVYTFGPKPKILLNLRMKGKVEKSFKTISNEINVDTTKEKSSLNNN